MEIMLDILKYYAIGCVFSAVMFIVFMNFAYKNFLFLKEVIFPIVSLLSWSGVIISLILLIKQIRIRLRLKKIKNNLK